MAIDRRDAGGLFPFLTGFDKHSMPSGPGTVLYENGFQKSHWEKIRYYCNRLYETDKNFLKTKVTGNIFTKMSVHCQLLTKRYVCTLYSIAVPGKYKCEGLARFSY